MLTSDLLRARVIRGEVRPCYVDLDEENLATAADLIALFEAAVGSPRCHLEEAIAPGGGGTTRPLYQPPFALLL